MKLARLLERTPYHPVLWAVYPPLVLLGNNITQLPVSSVYRAVIASLLLTVPVFLLGALIFRSRFKAAAITSLFLIFFFSYGHVHTLVDPLEFNGFDLGRHSLLIALYLVVFSSLAFKVARLKDHGNITLGFNVVGLILLLVPLYQIASYSAAPLKSSATEADRQAGNPLPQLQVLDGNPLPDIYYIILDTYTRADVLAGQFAYDNSTFLDALESRGFYVADCSQSNYSFTSISLTSSLNFDYVQGIDERLSPPNKQVRDLYPYLQENAAYAALEAIGYQLVAFDSGHSPTQLTSAAYYFSPESELIEAGLASGITPYESMLLNTTAGKLIFDFRPQFLDRPEWVQALESSYLVFRYRISYALEKVRSVPAIPGPKFVFVHILAPHNPFVFGPNGEHLTRSIPFTLNDDLDAASFSDYKAGFTGQVTYLNSQMLEIIDTLISQSQTPPLIILQGDHGVPRLPEVQNAILNAYYFPDGNYDRLYPSISPVNSFRVVFDQFFGAKLGLLDDTACVGSRPGDPYTCTILPDPNPACRQATP